ncbi:MAG: transcription elongation factor GreB [Gammaproteobacteria bacterium]|nr:MAG: transcription elongation factor GreB [Gammaproteobacteria bacterium]
MARSVHITREGFEALKAEQRTLWEKRREVVKHLSAAAAEGDRSENAEYIYRKKQLREIDRRIRYLQRRIPELKIVDRLPDDSERIFFGAWVEICDERGESRELRIVGADEFDPARNWISVDSPMARALLGKSAGLEVEVRLPDRITRLEIVTVRYSEQNNSE